MAPGGAGPCSETGVDSDLEALLAWSSLRGMELSAVRVESRPGRGRCLIAARDCAAEETLLVVPASAVIAETKDDGEYAASHWMLGLVHRLLEEIALGSASAYAPFIHLLLAGDQPLDLTSFYALPGAVGKRARYLDEQRCRIVGELCDAMPTCTASMAAQALYTVDTRTVYSKRLGVRALVPVFDFMNHDGIRCSARWSMDDDRAVRVEATRAIAAGEEISIFYDDIPNARLLLTYGFVVEGDCTHKSVELTFRFPTDAEDIMSDANSGGPCRELHSEACASAEVRILSDGAILRRALLAPLLEAARKSASAPTEKSRSSAGEVIFAEALLLQARSELSAWREVLSSGWDDERVATLAAGSAEVLERFVSRLQTWMDGPRDDSVMEALSRAPVDVSAITSSESEGEADS